VHYLGDDAYQLLANPPRPLQVVIGPGAAARHLSGDLMSSTSSLQAISADLEIASIRLDLSSSSIGSSWRPGNPSRAPDINDLDQFPPLYPIPRTEHRQVDPTHAFNDYGRTSVVPMADPGMSCFPSEEVEPPDLVGSIIQPFVGVSTYVQHRSPNRQIRHVLQATHLCSRDESTASTPEYSSLTSLQLFKSTLDEQVAAEMGMQAEEESVTALSTLDENRILFPSLSPASIEGARSRSPRSTCATSSTDRSSENDKAATKTSTPNLSLSPATIDWFATISKPFLENDV